MNPTHQLYKQLTNEEPSFLQELEQLADDTSDENVRNQLPLLLKDHFADMNLEEIDMVRLCTLLTHNLGGLDLTGEDFSEMDLRQFNFAGADLTGAQFEKAALSYAVFTNCILQEANFTNSTCQNVMAQHADFAGAKLDGGDWECSDFRHANLTKVTATETNFSFGQMDYTDWSHAHLINAQFRVANCWFCNFEGADLKTANMSDAYLFCCNFDHTNVQGSDLRILHDSEIYFGSGLKRNARTVISSQNHLLIGETLLATARSVVEEQFALYVQYKKALCWPDFIELLKRQQLLDKSDDLARWAMHQLMKIESLRSRVEEYAKEYEWLQDQQKDDKS